MKARSQSIRGQLARKRRRFAVLSPLLLAVFDAPAAPSSVPRDLTPDFRVIAPPGNPSSASSRNFLTDVFLDCTQRWGDGEIVRTVDQRVDWLVRRRFSDAVLQRSVATVKSYWQPGTISGRDLPPSELDSDDAVVKYVLKRRGAVDDVSGGARLAPASAVTVP